MVKRTMSKYFEAGHNEGLCEASSSLDQQVVLWTHMWHCWDTCARALLLSCWSRCEMPCPLSWCSPWWSTGTVLCKGQADKDRGMQELWAVGGWKGLYSLSWGGNELGLWCQGKVRSGSDQERKPTTKLRAGEGAGFCRLRSTICCPDNLGHPWTVYPQALRSRIGV